MAEYYMDFDFDFDFYMDVGVDLGCDGEVVVAPGKGFLWLCMRSHVCAENYGQGIGC